MPDSDTCCAAPESSLKCNLDHQFYITLSPQIQTVLFVILELLAERSCDQDTLITEDEWMHKLLAVFSVFLTSTAEYINCILEAFEITVYHKL